ncbi:MAG: type VII secretion protein EccB [Nocardioides sp.]
MATKRDLVEAHSFSRRRLVTAFVSGAPGGREVEPARPGRSIVGGAALSVLLIAGAAVTGVFSDRPDSDWDAPGLVISKEQGAAYVILDDEEETGEPPELRPVINITSARLILGAEGLEPRIVSQETIETRPLGEDIGILNAPASLPATDDLVDTGWTACTGPDRGLTVRVSSQVGVTPTQGTEAALVEVKGPGAGLWLVATVPESTLGPAQAYRYAVPDEDSDETEAFLRAVGLNGTAGAVKVPREWLDLFPRGGDLDAAAFDLDDLGEPAPGQPDGVRVGDYTRSDSGTGFLVDDTGALQPLSAFALALWSNLDLSSGGRGDRGPRERDGLDGGAASEGYAAARWPQDLLSAVPGQTCALLDAAADRPPLVQLATSPDEDASADRVLDPSQRLVDVDPGAGAYVVSGDFEGLAADTVVDGELAGSRFVVDQKGRANALVGADTPELLGYGAYAAPLVPSTWLDLFDAGVALSQEAALCPPQPEGAEPTCG